MQQFPQSYDQAINNMWINLLRLSADEVGHGLKGIVVGRMNALLSWSWNAEVVGFFATIYLSRYEMWRRTREIVRAVRVISWFKKIKSNCCSSFYQVKSWKRSGHWEVQVVLPLGNHLIKSQEKPAIRDNGNLCYLELKLYVASFFGERNVVWDKKNI